MKRARPGFSLIEVLLVVTLSAVLFGMASTLLVALLETGQRGMTDRTRAMIERDLAAAFRRDVRLARSSQPVKREGASSSLRFDFGDGTAVQYHAGPKSVLAEYFQHKERVRIEVYAIGSEARLQVQGRIAAIAWDGFRRQHGRAPCRVEAILGADRWREEQL